MKFAAGYAWNKEATFEANNKIIKEGGNYGGEDFFRMFSFPLLKGRAETALEEPLAIALSKKMAEDFFGSAEKAYGQTIRFQNKKDFKVTAVFDNVPSSSSLKFDYLLNWEEFLNENEWAKDWGNNAPETYLVLREGTDAKAFAKKITAFIENYFKEPNFKVRLDLQPFGDVYLHSTFKDGELSGGRIQYVRLFSVIAIFILLIACINFMNLTTARSVRRAKEIGVRKVVGAFRIALIRQFIGEALFFVFLAAIVSLVLVALVMPLFNELTHKQLTVPFADPRFLLGFAGLILLTGVVSGSYPALYLSSFNSISVLKGTIRFSTGALWFRKGLVVFQFVLSIVLIIGTIVVSRQIDYVQRINLGYDRENLLYVPLEGDLLKNYALFKNKAMALLGIQQVSRITDNPTNISNATGGVQWEGKDPTSMVQFAQAAVGYDFTGTLKIPLVQGRDFSKDFPTDSAGYIINETALKLIGYKDPVGKKLVFWQMPGMIIGVIKDCHFSSLHDPIRPIVLRLGETADYGRVLVRTERGKTREALASLERISKELNPKFPFTYSFSDDDYQKLYTSEKLVGKLSNAFAFLAIFISCLGLLGLAMFTAEQRTREFGIRKVLGASARSLFQLLSKEFIVLVLLALLIASPLAWYFMNSWLLDYAYRVNLSWWMFALAGSAAMMIALLTVSLQAIKAAFVNPVKSLRTE
ncbi:ABC transporter permease [Flavisolibacter nicotianae]|uniref:ABC transporter permease n=1 Tax=Flavisolibacter nicotianae TaxID=2364882 RepID=UPI00196984C7|nr:ABC transporter permease [Flavisolibacter nicotianae]